MKVSWLAWVALVQALLLWSCWRPAEGPPLEEDRFVDLYVSSARLNSRYGSSPDSLKALRERLFKDQGVTPAGLERAIAWYADHPERALRVMERVTRLLGETGRAGAGPKARPGGTPKP